MSKNNRKLKATIVGWLIAVLSVVPSVTQAASPAVLVDEQLQRHAVLIQSLEEGMISYFDEQRHLQADPISQFVQIRVPDRSETAAVADTHRGTATTTPDQVGLIDEGDVNIAPGPGDGMSNGANLAAGQAVIELIDGQRLTGQWTGAADEGQSLRWTHPLLGHASVPLTQIRSVALLASSSDPDFIDTGSASIDQVWMINGDKMTGFVVAVDGQTVEFQPQDQRQTMQLPLDRLTRIVMSNPLQPTPTSKVHWVELRDTTRIAVDSIRIAQDQLFIGSCPMLPTIADPMAMQQVAKIVPSRSDGALMDLSRLPMRTMGESLVFGTKILPQLVEDAVEMHAPANVEFDLPQGTARLACTIRLATPPRTYTQEWDWAGCEVTVRVDLQALATFTLNVESPSVTINSTLDGKILSFTIDESVNGPVMDRVLIEDAMLLVTRHAQHDKTK